MEQRSVRLPTYADRKANLHRASFYFLHLFPHTLFVEICNWHDKREHFYLRIASNAIPWCYDVLHLIAAKTKPAEPNQFTTSYFPAVRFNVFFLHLPPCRNWAVLSKLTNRLSVYGSRFFHAYFILILIYLIPWAHIFPFLIALNLLNDPIPTAVRNDKCLWFVSWRDMGRSSCNIFHGSVLICGIATNSM